jgi:glycosyltransferase involved in cell wall biosynthesis
MKICMLSSSYPKYEGDVTAPFIESIATGVAALGHEVHLLLPHHPDIRRPAEEKGVKFHFFRYAPTKKLHLWGYADSLQADVTIKRAVYALVPLVVSSGLLSLARLTARERFDIINAHWVIPNAPIAALVSGPTRTPLVVSLHGSDVFVAERKRAIGLAARAAFRRSAAVTACSHDLLGRAIGLGAPAERSRVIPYGVDPALFQPNASERARIRDKLGLAADDVMVLAVGRLVYKKGFEYLLRAAPSVLAAHGKAVFVIAGAGDLAGELRDLAQSLGVADRVLFPGSVLRGDVSGYYCAADIFALPSVRDREGNVDGLPNVLLEAMASARPIVASRVAGVPDVIDDGVSGLLVAEKEPDQIAAALIRLIDSPNLRSALAVAARAEVEADLTWPAIVRRYADVYRSAISLRN